MTDTLRVVPIVREPSDSTNKRAVYVFCTRVCRAAFLAEHTGRMDEIDSAVFGFVIHCDTCGGPVQ